MVRPLAILMLAALALGGCGRSGEAGAGATLDAPAYAAPPVVTAVSVARDGSLLITGRAGPDERVRLIEMDGEAHGVTADPEGDFSIPLPRSGPTDRLLNLSVQRAGQSVSSDGWLFSPAGAPARAVMLRPGGASLPVGEAPLLATVDLDSGGGLALAGRTAAGQAVSVRLDGVVRGQAEADAAGRWFLVLPAATPLGPHRISVASGDRRMERDLALEPARPSSALETTSTDGQVRIAWALPGGGAQTTFILLP